MRRLLLTVALLSAVACECGRNPPDHSDGGSTDDASIPDSGTFDDGGFDAGADAGDDDAGFDAGADGGHRSDAGVPISALCSELTSTWCDRLLSCGDLDPAQRDDCPLLLAWLCNQEQLSSLVDGGAIGYSETQARACLNGILDVPCGPELPGSAACDDLLPSLTPNGGACSRQTNGCANGFCNGNDCSAICAPYVAIDAGCSGNFGDECGPMAYCRNARCTPLLLAGQACAPNDACLNGLCDNAKCVEFGSLGIDAGCVTEAECTTNLACIDGICQARHSIAQPCRIYGGTQCASDFTCRSFDGGLSGICWPRSDAGEGCDGVPEDCFEGLVCNSPSLFAPGTCLPFVGEDAGCDRTVQNCRFGLVCGFDSRCHRLPHPGERCVSDPKNFRSSDCAGGYCDDPGDGGTCRSPQDAGESCSRPWDCASNICSANNCAAQCL